MSALQQTYIDSMNMVEARACLIAIRGNLSIAAQLAAEFDNRLGWKALGYDSLDACLQAEFGHPTLQAFIKYELKYSQSQSYRLASTNQVATTIQQQLPTGSDPIVMRERWVRDSGIADLPAAQQAEAYQKAISIAQSESSTVTASHFVTAVEIIKSRDTVFQSPYAVVSNDVATDKITADTGRAFVKALDALPARKQSYVLQLMSKFGLTCPDLVSKLAGVFDRPPGQESYMQREIELGYLGGKKLAEATLTDWSRAAHEASRQHQADAAEAKRQALLAAGKPVFQDVTLTLPAGDWKKCIEVLRKELGDNGFEYLMRAGMEI